MDAKNKKKRIYLVGTFVGNVAVTYCLISKFEILSNVGCSLCLQLFY